MIIFTLMSILLLAQAPTFDTHGTITDVLTPSSLKIDDKIVNLEGVDASGLNMATYAILMQDLDDWLIGKDVFVKGNYVYFDLVGSYNSVSINEQIQNEILKLIDYYQTQYVYGISPKNLELMIAR